MAGENTKFYVKQGGDEVVLLSGGTFEWYGAKAQPIHSISKTLGISDFTVSSASIGTGSFGDQLPIGAIFLYGKLVVSSAFSGDTTANITIGDGTDADRYNTGNITVFTAAANGRDVGDPSGLQYHAAAVTPVVTLTVASTLSGVATPASLAVTLYYLATA